MAAEQELGALIARYETDNQRRRKIFVVAVPLGAVAACLGALMLVLIGGSAGASGAVLLPGLVCGLGLGSCGAGIWQGWLSVTRPDEVFALYEGGLVHAYAGKSWAISWGKITKVTNQSERYNPLGRAFGADVRYRIKLGSAVGGRRVVMITGLTNEADRLGEIVRQAAHDGVRPRPGTA